MTEPRSLRLVALVIAVALGVINIRVIAGGETWSDVEYQTEVVPPRLAASAAIRSGELPAWWDGTGFGVPLLADPTHGGVAPPLMFASSQRGFDFVLLVYLAWTALGVAVWARTRGPLGAAAGASDQAALVCGLLVATSGVLVSSALRGSLPGLAHLPWLGAVMARLVHADTRTARARMTAALAGLLGAIALSGELGALLDGLVIIACIGARRGIASWLACAVAVGLALGAIVWVPVLLHVPHAVGATFASFPLSRLLELIVPTRDLAALAGATPVFPSIFVGAPLIAFVLVRTPTMRVRVLVALLVVLVAVSVRALPAWLGAPEVHVAALAIVAGSHAGLGIDALLARNRRAMIAMLVAVACAGIGLGAFVMLATGDVESIALDRASFDGLVGLVCAAGALLLCHFATDRKVTVSAVLALVVASSAGMIGSLAPTTERALVEREPAFVASVSEAPKPARLFRPAAMHATGAELEDALGTLAGTSASRWELIAARSESPARPLLHDRVWLAAANEGGALLDRYGIGLAILPATMLDSPRNVMSELARRGEWGLTALPVQPVAAVMRSWLWNRDPNDAISTLFPSAGGMLPRGQLVLSGAGPAGGAPIAPVPCAVKRWSPGAIDLSCTAVDASYAVVTSSSAPGWSVTVDGVEQPWVTADLLRRAVAIGVGTHALEWRYSPPGLTIGAVLSLAALLALIALVVATRGPAQSHEDHKDHKEIL